MNEFHEQIAEDALNFTRLQVHYLDTPSGSSSIGRVLAFQANGCEFEARLPLQNP